MDINQIAKLAGVSRATVSRYLNDGYVSDEKKKKIARVIEQTGYIPSQQAQTLRTGKTNVVGIIIPKINSASVARMISGMTTTFRSASYQVLLANTDNDESIELEYLRMFNARNQVDGVILVGTVLTPQHTHVISKLRIPLVLVAQTLNGVSCVIHDDRSAQRDVTEVLLEKSVHPAYIGVKESDVSAGKMRHLGFLDACHAHNIEVPQSAQLISDFTADGGYECCEKLLRSYPEVDGIACATDTIALGAMTCLREFGCSVPEDVRVSGIGDDETGRLIYPSLTTVRHHYKTTGAEAAKLLLEHIQNKDAIAHDVMMSYEVIRRRSTT